MPVAPAVVLAAADALLCDAFGDPTYTTCTVAGAACGRPKLDHALQTGQALRQPTQALSTTACCWHNVIRLRHAGKRTPKCNDTLRNMLIASA